MKYRINACSSDGINNKYLAQCFDEDLKYKKFNI